MWVTISPRDFNPRNVFKRNVNIYSHKNSCMNSNGSIIHHSPKVEITQCPSTDEWINKMWYIHIIEYSLAIKKERSYDLFYNMDEPCAK